MDVYAAESARGHLGYRSKKYISAVLMFDPIQYSNTSQACTLLAESCLTHTHKKNLTAFSSSGRKSYTYFFNFWNSILPCVRANHSIIEFIS